MHWWLIKRRMISRFHTSRSRCIWSALDPTVAKPDGQWYLCGCRQGRQVSKDFVVLVAIQTWALQKWSWIYLLASKSCNEKTLDLWITFPRMVNMGIFRSWFAYRTETILLKNSFWMLFGWVFPWCCPPKGPCHRCNCNPKKPIPTGKVSAKSRESQSRW